MWGTGGAAGEAKVAGGGGVIACIAIQAVQHPSDRAVALCPAPAGKSILRRAHGAVPQPGRGYDDVAVMSEVRLSSLCLFRFQRRTSGRQPRTTSGLRQSAPARDAPGADEGAQELAPREASRCCKVFSICHNLASASTALVVLNPPGRTVDLSHTATAVPILPPFPSC